MARGRRRLVLNADFLLLLVCNDYRSRFQDLPDDIDIAFTISRNDERGAVVEFILSSEKFEPVPDSLPFGVGGQIPVLDF